MTILYNKEEKDCSVIRTSVAKWITFLLLNAGIECRILLVLTCNRIKITFKLFNEKTTRGGLRRCKRRNY